MESSDENRLRNSIAGEEDWCKTVFKSGVFSFVWTVEEFIYCPQKTGEHLISSAFPRKSDVKPKWVLRLYPNGYSTDCEEYVSLFLGLEDSIVREVVAKYTLFIVGTQEARANFLEGMATFLYKGKQWGSHRFVKRNILISQGSGLLSDGNLKICCEISVIFHPLNVSGPMPFELSHIPKCSLSENFGNLLDDPVFSDVTLIVNGIEFPTHKAILSARSPVFYAMFNNQMRETNGSRVEITDISYEVMSDIVYFMYTGKVRNLKANAYELLSAADKYGLYHLKGMCEVELASNFSVQTVADVLHLADIHNAKDLKISALDFITRHCGTVRKTAGWRHLATKAPHLVDEAYSALLLKVEPVATIDADFSNLRINR